MKVIREIFIPQRLYLSMMGLSLCYILAFFIPGIIMLCHALLIAFSLLTVIDLVMLFGSIGDKLSLTRELPARFSNGDDNPVEIFIQNQSPLDLKLEIYDEVPVQFQLRDFVISGAISAYQERKINYHLKPKTRGDYKFGFTNIRLRTRLGILGRQIRFGKKEHHLAVYPSFLSMHRYEFLAVTNRLTDEGIKRVRRIGTHSEFDQIKEYVKGDNYRTINWRATARMNKLMVNQYQEQRSQHFYNVIDKGRLMQMPFNGMSLLDYAINSALIMTNTALIKHDRAGLITFNQRIDTFLRAERKNETLPRILNKLYAEQTEFMESDYALLAGSISRQLSQRSLLILYTNYETITSLKRHLQYYKSIARKHLLVVVIFENELIRDISRMKADKLEDVYIKTLAEKHIFDKKLIIKELHKNGIHGMLTRPEDLSVALINKYLELKDTGRF